MDTRTSTYPGYRYGAGPDLDPAAVTRWTAQLVDPQCEHAYRAERFPDELSRGLILTALASVAGVLNFLVQLYAYAHGASVFDALIPPFFSIWLPIVGFLMVQRLQSPAALEAVMIICVAVGAVARLALATLHPPMTYMWPTLIIGVVFVIYLYLPVRFGMSVVLAAVFSIVAPLWWLLSQGALLPPDHFYRGLIWLLFANALGFMAGNSLHRSQRAQFAQSLVLKELLSTDAMTGIGNRRRFDDALDREWRRCGRSGSPISLVMIDVDHFKAYNDRLGHQQGDDCLRQVARLLVDCVGRPGDLVARYGGEEFVCLLPAIDAEGARSVAGKFVMAIARASIPHPALPDEGRLTISVGVATATDVAAQSPGDLVALSDKLLYDAKRAGRDQVAAALL